MRALKRRINHKNPNVQLLALGVRISTAIPPRSTDGLLLT